MGTVNLLSALAVPLILGVTAAFGLLRGVDVYGALTDGAKRGLRTVMEILPPMTVFLAAVSMLRASGAMEGLISAVSPVLRFLGIPPETAAIVLLRPLSGSGGLAAGTEILRQYGPDSLVGRTASVMLGSTETTFYVIGVYFAAAGVKKTRWAIPAALCADLAGFLAAAWVSRIFWGG